MVKTLTIKFEELKSKDELTQDELSLYNQAVAAAQDAYAPYSRFKVGCAILLENGTVITGNNQENAAYPLGLCAERVAFFNAGANHKGIRLVRAAIYAESELFEVTEAVSPCGACRQAMSEYEQNQHNAIPLIMGGAKGPVVKTESVSVLLPLTFGKNSLNL